jgi:hypothetical protein
MDSDGERSMASTIRMYLFFALVDFDAGIVLCLAPWTSFEFINKEIDIQPTTINVVTSFITFTPH